MRRVIYYDISIGNLLLNKDLNIRLYDFQRRLLYPNSIIHLNNDSIEGVKLSILRSDPNDAN